MTNTLQRQIEFADRMAEFERTDPYGAQQPRIYEDIATSLRRLAAIDSAGMPEEPKEITKMRDFIQHPDSSNAHIVNYIDQLRAVVQTQSVKLHEAQSARADENARDAENYRTLKRLAQPAYVVKAEINADSPSLHQTRNLEVWADSWKEMDKLLSDAAIAAGKGEWK